MGQRRCPGPQRGLLPAVTEPGTSGGDRRRDTGVVAIRAARASELSALQDIERAAGEMFRQIGMPAIADDGPWPLEVLAGYEKAGRLWVVSDLQDRPVGYLMADLVDGCLHVEQVSVHTGSARRGLRRGLVGH